VSENTLCWREGMPNWQPLAEVEPFATALAQAKAAARRRYRRVAIALVVTACIIAIPVTVFLLLRDPPEVRAGEKHIASGNHTEAIQVLGPYIAKNPDNYKAVYLLALAYVNELDMSEMREEREANRYSRKLLSI